MNFSVLITGGAGFVGSGLAINLKKKYPNAKIVAFDNLKRRGSELNLEKFKTHGIEFAHGDIRVYEDLEALKQTFDFFIEASAEPSVHAGSDGDPSYLLQTNLVGTLNALKFSKNFCQKMIFLSTSRVYSIEEMTSIKLKENDNRFTHESNLVKGLTEKGINEDFSTKGFRSLYGATKLASELVIEEYAHIYNLDLVINRCGVIAGPGQWGKVDQGVFTLWVANHFFEKPLKYTGFGGTGKQVRDLLHPDDLFYLVEKQLFFSGKLKAPIFNVGGGLECSTSLKELTKICEDITGHKIKMDSNPETAKVDIPFYVSDNSRVSAFYKWQPQKTTQHIVKDIHKWLVAEKEKVKWIFA